MCCLRDISDFFIAVDNCDKKCSFHPKGSSFPINKLTPDGLCLEAFSALYPHCFAMIYSSKYNEVFCQCPKNETVKFRIYRKPVKFFYRIKNTIKSVINIFYSLDIIRYRIFIEVVDTINNSCCKHHISDIFELNLGQKLGEACPAVFNSIFPALFARLVDNDTKNTLDINCINCPDHRVNVRLRLKENDYPQDILKSKICSLNIALTQEYDALNKIPCLLARHVIFPYYLALFNNAEFPGFYTRNKHAAYLQCPSVENKIEMLLEKTKKNDYLLHITGQHKDCPKGLQLNQEIKLN
jgi:uncharacterized repeat protein (TIGR04076 family)